VITAIGLALSFLHTPLDWGWKGVAVFMSAIQCQCQW